MHRTQIYFEETFFDAIKLQAKSLGLSLSAYIRTVLQEDLKSRKSQAQDLDFSPFSGLWKDRAISQDSIRKKAWKK